MFERILHALRALFHPDLSPQDVAAALDTAAAHQGERLDWRNSIVDLMKLLNLDSSLAARRVLAQDIGYAEPFDGTADQNLRLHTHLMTRLAEHGIVIPKEAP